MSRQPQEIREQGNRLKDEGSLYLRQHAHNPIDWFPWGEQALERARAADCPIFLSVGYASCHWCHVMEQEVFEDDEVAELLNTHFVCIKLDREERPDLDAVYMEALQALSGGGGWPMSLFLTPDLKPFHGETYMPRQRFLALARRIMELFSEHREMVTGQAALLHRRVATDPELSPEAEVDRQVLQDAARQAEAYHDMTWGGFRGQMKFPTPPRWRFLLHHHRRTGEERWADMVRRTLDNMASGGIHDQLGGGFHRYATEPTWVVPHFEKMLYDNAQLAGLFCEAYQALGVLRYGEVARATLDFLLREMQDEAGGFHASYDADSGGAEGTYYVWTPAELRRIAGDDDGAALAGLLGVTQEGNFEGRAIPTLRADRQEVARQSGVPVEALGDLLERWRPALLEARARREPPGLDRKLVTAWNGMAISAMAAGHLALGDRRYLEAAERAAERLWALHRRPAGGLLRSSNDGVAANEAVLGDYAFLGLGLLDLHQASQDPLWLRRTLALVEVVRERFAHPEAGFYQTPADHPAPMGRQVEFLDSVRPSANAAMALLLVRAGALSGRAAYRQQAEAMLGAFSPWMKRFGLEMAAWMDAADSLLGPLYEVVVAGEPGADETRALVAAVRKFGLAQVLLITVPADGPDEQTAALMPTTAGKTSQGRVAAAYVCEQGSCNAPVFEAEALRRLLGEGGKS